jgi:hypothetical protein
LYMFPLSLFPSLSFSLSPSFAHVRFSLLASLSICFVSCFVAEYGWRDARLTTRPRRCQVRLRARHRRCHVPETESRHETTSAKLSSDTIIHRCLMHSVCTNPQRMNRSRREARQCHDTRCPENANVKVLVRTTSQCLRALRVSAMRLGLPPPSSLLQRGCRRWGSAEAD